MKPTINPEFIEDYAQRVTDNICSFNDVDPKDMEARALLAYRLSLSNEQLPKTRRFLYDIITNKMSSQTGCHSITGTRKVGKTTLLKQIQQEYKDSAYYIDVFVIGTTSYESLFSSLWHRGIKYVLIDEVCKLCDDRNEFISAVKNYCNVMCFLITGSTSFVVRDLHDAIGRGEEYALPPFMYIEKLCWSNGIDSIDTHVISSHVNNSTLLEYVKNAFMSNAELLSYMRSVVNDTINSYRSHSTLEGDISISSENLNNALTYISLCQLVYRRFSDNQYSDLPTVPYEVKEALGKKDVGLLKGRLNLSNRDIELTLSILCSCGLAKKIQVLRDFEHNGIDAYLFEYPWYVSYCLSPRIQEQDSFIDMWIEYLILNRASYVYSNVSKLRTLAQDEVDVLYTLNGWQGIEVKNRPYENNSRKYLRHLDELKNLYGLKDIVVTDNETNAKIVAALELEYIQITQCEQVTSSSSLRTIIERIQQ